LTAGKTARELRYEKDSIDTCIFCMLYKLSGIRRRFLFEKKPAKPPATTPAKPPEANNSLENELKKVNEELGRINGELRDIKRGQAAGGNTGTPPKDNTSNQVTADKIPVTPKIVQFLLQNEKNSDGLKFYLSRPFTLKISEQNEIAEIEIRNNMIIINPANPANEREIDFPITSEGILMSGIENGRELQIFFQKQSKKLVFTRNVQQNSYELVNIEGIKDYKSNITEPILLLVSGQNNRNAEVHAVPIDFTVNNSNNNRSQTYQNKNIVYDNITPNVNANRSVNTSRSVMGTGSTNPQRVIAFARKKNPALSNNDIAIINEYFKEAGYEGVNIDLAIAQMLHATDYFRNRERMATRNYGGLSGASFQDWTIGVRAHIQHLKAYAHQRPNRELVDPRFSLAWERGSPGITFDQVYPIWSQRSDYRQNIEAILRNL